MKIINTLCFIRLCTVKIEWEFMGRLYDGNFCTKFSKKPKFSGSRVFLFRTVGRDIWRHALIHVRDHPLPKIIKSTKKKKRNPCEKRHLTVEFAIYRLCYSYVKRKKCRCSKIWRCAYRFMVIIIFQQVNQLPSTPYHSLICLYGFFFRASAQQRTYINISKMLTALLSFIVGWNVCDAGPNCTVRNFTDIKCIDLILLFFVIAIVIGRDSFISRLAYTHPSSQNDHAYICNIKHNHLFEILQLFVYD